MAFTKNPVQSTYDTTRISLQREMSGRDPRLDKDEDYLNMFFEPVRMRTLEDKRYYLTKRPGTALAYTAGSGSARGIHYWVDQKKIFFVIDNDMVVRDIEASTTTILSNFFDTFVGECGFCEYLYEDNSVVIVATDGETLKTIADDNTIVEVTDVDMPVPHLPCPIFLDGYLFLAKEDTAEIWNSDLNDPTAWTEGNFIVAEMEGDWILKIAKLNNYLIAFGSNSIEYFWDAGVETGSPLQRNDTPIKINGYLGAFAKYGNSIFYVGNDSLGQPDVYRLDDFKIKSIGTPFVSKFLITRTSNKSDWKGNVLAVSGRNFYLLNAGFRTYVYDVELNIWTRWAYQSEQNFPINFAVNANQSNRYICYFSMAGSDEDIHYFDEDLYQDADENYTFRIVTNKEDFDTYNRKSMHRLSVLADTTEADAYIEVSWTDDDYKTYSDARSINLNQELPSTYQLGQFRRRAFKLVFEEDAPLRVEELEVDINKGST